MRGRGVASGARVLLCSIFFLLALTAPRGGSDNEVRGHYGQPPPATRTSGAAVAPRSPRDAPASPRRSSTRAFDFYDARRLSPVVLEREPAHADAERRRRAEEQEAEDQRRQEQWERERERKRAAKREEAVSLGLAATSEAFKPAHDVLVPVGGHWETAPRSPRSVVADAAPVASAVPVSPLGAPVRAAVEPVAQPRSPRHQPQQQQARPSGKAHQAEEMLKRVLAAEAEAAAFDAELLRLHTAREDDTRKLQRLQRELAALEAAPPAVDEDTSESRELRLRLQRAQHDLSLESAKAAKLHDRTRQHEMVLRTGAGVDAELAQLHRQLDEEKLHADTLERDVAHGIAACEALVREVETAEAQAAAKAAKKSADEEALSADVLHYRAELGRVQAELASQTERVNRLKLVLEQETRSTRAEIDQTEGDYQRQLAKLKAQLASLVPEAEGKN